MARKLQHTVVVMYSLIFVIGCGSSSNSDNSGIDAGDGSNTAPTISGSPTLTAREGGQYRFTPTATDSDNDTLTFSVLNKPSWLSFDQATGELSGTPAKSDIGLYSSITISVSDGVATASLAGFDLTVKSTSATISWLAPTAYTDESPLPMSDIAGYKIYSGSTSNSLSELAVIRDPYATSYEATNLIDGTHYFSVSVFITDMTESVLSTVVSKSI